MKSKMTDHDWREIQRSTGQDIPGMVMRYKVGEISAGGLMELIADHCETAYRIGRRTMNTDKPETPYTAGPLEPEHDPGQTFWMVYVAGRQAPAYQHYDLTQALEEAGRLCRKEPGRNVYLMRSDRYTRVDLVPCSWRNCEP